MKKFLLTSTFILTIFRLSVFAQAGTEELVRRVADHVIQTSSFQFVNSKTGARFASTKDLDTSVSVKAESRYNKWDYVNGVLTVGMLRASDVLHDQKYA